MSSFIRTDAAGNPRAFDPILTKATQTEQTDGTFTLELVCLGAVDVTKYDHLLYKDDGGRLRDVVVVSPEVTHDSTGTTTSIVCHDAIATNGDAIMLYDVRCRALTAQQCLDKALAKGDTANAVYDSVQTDDAKNITNTTISYYHQTEWASVAALSEQVGLEVQRYYTMADTSDGTIRTLGHVGLYKAVGRANVPEADKSVPTRRFDYGYDISSVTRTITATTVATCMYGFGKSLETDSGGYSRKLTFESVNNGKPYVKADDATVKRWGFPTASGGTHTRDAIYENSDCEDANQLLRETKAALAAANAPQVSYTVDPAELGDTPLYLGELVQVVDHQLGLAAEARVSKRETNLLTGGSTITLGVTTNSLTSQTQESTASASSTASTAVATAQATAATTSDIQPTVSRVNAGADSWDAAAKKVSADSSGWDKGAALANTFGTSSTGLPQFSYSNKTYVFDPASGVFKEA